MRFFRKPWLGLFWLCLGLATTPLFAQTPPFSYTSDVRDTLGRMREDEERRLIDPALGRVPYERLAEEREKLIKAQKLGTLSTQAAIPGITWQERGPSNAGGRTKAVLFDPNDPAKKKVWIGSPLSGLWYTNDITDANVGWTPVSDTWESTAVNCLAADPSNAQVMYAGTGDYQGYSGRIVGGGIWKTTDGGATWTRLTATIPAGSYPSLGRGFEAIQKIVVNGSGHVFAATLYGLARSTDGGASWAFVLAPNQGIGVSPSSGQYWFDLVSDLEIGTDGILYAAFQPSRVFKATNAGGTAWAEITPTAVPSGGSRTELALVPTTNGASQEVYAVSQAYNSSNYGQDIKWFVKSVNAGSAWTTVPIPSYSNGDHFTRGRSDRSLVLTVDPTNTNVVFAGGCDAWFRSTNGGGSWSSPLWVGPTYLYQYALAFQPGNAANTVVVNDYGVNLVSNWGTSSASTSPTVVERNLGYGGGIVSAAAMKPIVGSNYLLTQTYGLGPATQNAVGPGSATSLFGRSGDPSGRAFSDANEANLQVFSNYSSWYTLTGSNSTSWLFSLNGWYQSNPAAYDSQNNVLYVAEWQSSDNSNYIRRVAGIGGAMTSTRFKSGDYPYAMKLSNDQQSLFVGYNSLIVKYTNLAQAVPTATTLSTGGYFPSYAIISSIDVGSTDNDILVTTSSYGVPSVWFTNNGGVTWTNKDPSGSGLPDIAVHVGMFNPQNRQQVVLGTDLGIWTTNSFFDPNPVWGLSSAGMPLLRINSLTYRASDGRLITTTQGRGVYETNAFAIPYTPSSIALTGVSNTTLCAGSPLSVSFTTSGPISSSSTTYEVWVSDANGNFTNQKRIGTGASSPVSVTLPTGFNALDYGTGYKVRVVSPDYDITSTTSTALSIGNMVSYNLTDKRATSGITYGNAVICPGDQIVIKVDARDPYYNGVFAESATWFRDGTIISGVTSPTLLTQQAGTYTVAIKQAGCTLTGLASYILYINPNPGLSVITGYGVPPGRSLPQCSDSPLTISASYPGESATYQWFKDGAAISGATSQTYAANQSGAYSFQLVSGSECTATVTPEPLVFGNSLYAHLSVVPKTDTVLCGNTGISLFLDEIYYNQIAGGQYSAKWYRDGMLVTVGTNLLAANAPGNYVIELQQGSCVTRSNSIVIRQGELVPPRIVNAYSTDLSDNAVRSETLCAGSSRSLSVEIGSSYGYSSIQWQQNGVDIPGATSYELSATATGSYTVRVTKGTCSAVSPAVSLVFSNGLTPVITAEGTNWETCTRKRIGVLGNFQAVWFRDGVVIPNATSSIYDATQSGIYSVSVTNGSCTGLSKGYHVRIGVPTKPVIIVTTKSDKACSNNAALLRIPDYFSGTVQWLKNGVAIAGATRNRFFATQSGKYSVVIQGTACSAESDPVEVRIGEPTAATIAGNALISSGQTATLPIQLSGPAPWLFTLSNGQTVQNTYLNPHPVSVTATSTTTYSVVNVQNACGAGTAAGQAVVTVGSGSADLWLSSLVNNRTPRLGEIVSYSLVVINEGPQAANGVTITSQLPTGVEFVAAEVGNVSTTNGLVTASVGSVAPSGSQTVSYQLRITQPGTFFTTAQVATTSTPDPDSQPNSGTGDGQDDQTVIDLRTADAVGALVASANPDQVPIPTTQSNQPTPQAGKVELSLEMRSSALSVPAGEPQNLSVVVSNRGAVTATNVEIRVLLPTGWSLTNNTGYLVNGQTVRGYVNQLTAGTSSVLVLPVQGNATGVVQAQIQAVNEPVSNASPGNGFTNGERDEASLQLRVR